MKYYSYVASKFVNIDSSIQTNLVFNYSIIDNGFYNDSDGAYPFWPIAQTDNGLLYSWHPARDFNKNKINRDRNEN